MASKEAKHIDVSNMPELLELAEEVRNTGKTHVLQRGGEELAQITPVAPRAKSRIKGRPTSADDPIWNIVGMAHSSGPGDVSENVDKYLADAYLNSEV